MTKEDLIRRLEQLQRWGDTEEAHEKADQALLLFINDKDIEMAYDAVPKWYA